MTQFEKQAFKENFATKINPVCMFTEELYQPKAEGKGANSDNVSDQ